MRKHPKVARVLRGPCTVHGVHGAVRSGAPCPYITSFVLEAELHRNAHGTALYRLPDRARPYVPHCTARLARLHHTTPHHTTPAVGPTAKGHWPSPCREQTAWRDPFINCSSVTAAHRRSTDGNGVPKERPLQPKKRKRV